MVEGKKGWHCKECDADFEWLVKKKMTKKELKEYGGCFDFKLAVPKNKKELNKAELHTNFGMFEIEFYPALEADDLCNKCKKKVEELEKKKKAKK